MSDRPTGTVTFLFSDIEGSTRLLQELGGDRYGRIQDEHAALMRRAIDEGGGVEIRTEGDSFFIVFPSHAGAVRAATAVQRALATHPWPDGVALRVRMGLHSGEGRLGGDDYLGIDVNRAARIAAAGHGGQVVLSDATRRMETVRPEDVDETGAWVWPKESETPLGSLPPEIPGHNPNPSLRATQAQGLIADGGNRPSWSRSLRAGLFRRGSRRDLPCTTTSRRRQAPHAVRRRSLV